MGTGSKPSEKKVTKTRQSSSGGVGGGQQQETADSCIFSVRSEVFVKSSLGIRKGDSAVIVPNYLKGELDLYLADNLIGQYVGKSAKRMLDCIGKGYMYEGEVNEVQIDGLSVTVLFSLVGKMR